MESLLSNIAHDRITIQNKCDDMERKLVLLISESMFINKYGDTFQISASVQLGRVYSNKMFGEWVNQIAFSRICRFETAYREPPNFPEGAVMGSIMRLFRMKDPKDANALSLIALPYVSLPLLPSHFSLQITRLSAQDLFNLQEDPDAVFLMTFWINHLFFHLLLFNPFLNFSTWCVKVGIKYLSWNIRFTAHQQNFWSNFFSEIFKNALKLNINFCIGWNEYYTWAGVS